ncbi:MAG TPA: NUDIX domain-containing protein [Blastocatellia bacterium]|nr:NUDIX domain-containing protein [Blastocatellia bacterium]
MTELLNALRSEFRNALIIGTIPITEPEHWSVVTEFFGKMDSANLRCDVIAESDTQLFQHSLRTDTSYGAKGVPRVPFKQLRGRRDLVQREMQKSDSRKQRGRFLVSTLPLPLYVVRLDESFWYLPITGSVDRLESYRKLSTGDPWFQLVASYVDLLVDPTRDGRYLAAPTSELLELFDQKHIPRGIYPRDCFYDTDHYQYVVWDFVFSRRGELLIHKRSANAKDNQSMWDKSVGGHIDFNRERSSADAAVRELIEELYTKEQQQQTGHAFSLLSEDPQHVYFLGDWRPDDRGPEYLNHVGLLERDVKRGHEPWVQYRIPGTLEHNTPRQLPDGTQRRLRVLADVFIVIANTLLTADAARRELQNSEYLLLEPATIKTWIENGHDDRGDEFRATLDLEFIMTGALRDTIEEASQIIKYAEIRR